MAGDVFLFLLFFEAIFFVSLFLIFDLHMYCDDMLINWIRLLSLSSRSGDGLYTVPRPSWCVGFI